MERRLSHQRYVSCSLCNHAMKTNSPQYVVSARSGQFHCEARSANCSIIQSLLMNAIYMYDAKGTETWLSITKFCDLYIETCRWIARDVICCTGNIWNHRNVRSNCFYLREIYAPTSRRKNISFKFRIFHECMILINIFECYEPYAVIRLKS